MRIKGRSEKGGGWMERREKEECRIKRKGRYMGKN
jgi:hypothetical protein